MNSFVQDVVYATRQLRRSYGFTASAVLTLGLGIGANLTVFLILYGVLLRPLPFPKAQQLVRLERAYPDGERGQAYTGTQFLFIQRSARSFQAAAAYDYLPSNVNLVQGGGAVPLKTLRTSADFFRVFQMEPRLGRGFRADDMLPNAAGVAVLSDELWRLKFNSDPHILGRSITLGNRPYTVIGVANPKFRLDAAVDLWVPLPIAASPDDRSHDFTVVARLRPNVPYAQATDDLKRVVLEFQSVYPALWDKFASIALVNYRDSVVGDIRPALEVLMGAVGLLLAMVAANILSLLLVRSIARRREMSLRAALGASGWRLLRQLLTENAVLCAAGALVGVLLAQITAPVLMRLSPLPLPSFSSVALDAPAFVFAGLLAAGCAVWFSIVPALESRRSRLTDSMRANASQIAPGRNLAQKALVTSQVAISLMLLTGAALLLTSFWNLLHTPAGFDSRNVLSFKTAFSPEQAASTTQYSQHVGELLGRVEALPGVASAAAVNDLPTQLVPDFPFDIVGRSPDRADAAGDTKYIPVTAHYFDTLRIPVQAGRGFTADDTRGSPPVIVINRQFARTFFKGENPIGQRIRIGASMGPGFEDPIREIVGVAGDVKQSGLDQPAPGILYLPQAQIPDTLTRMGTGLLGTSWVVRLKSSGLEIEPALRQLFMRNAQTPLLSVEPLAAAIDASLAQQRFSMLLLSGFGLIALLLGAAGLYGVLSYTVARRTQEIGVRMAVGAQRSDIVGMVLRQAGALVAAGLVVGIVATLAGAQLLQSLVFEVAPRSPITIGLAASLLLLTGLLAAWLPARRAAIIEPMQALRSE